jgi:hypothetical protein
MPSERTYKAPVAEYNNRLHFSRFKYAEEAAAKIDKQGHAWIMFRGDDEIEVESGEFDGVPYRDEFTVPQFVVLWNE